MTTTNFLEELKASAKPYVKIYVSLDDREVVVSAYKDEEKIYYKKTGVGFNELAFAFEDEVIPLRDMLEALGYSTTEEFLVKAKK